VTRSYERLFASRDARGGLILLLAGVVLLPSLALSVLSFRFITRLAAAERLNLLHDADGRRWYLEQQLGQALRLQALEAARLVGPRVLASGPPERIHDQLSQFGVDAWFDTLHLDVSSVEATTGSVLADARELQVEREALASQGPEPFLGASGIEALPLLNGRGDPLGLLRFRYTRAGLAAVIRKWFDHEFAAPWDDDSVEIFIDGTTDGKATYNSFTRQFLLRFQDPDLWEQHDRTYGVGHALAAAAGGYTLELAVPWTHLGVRPAPGQTIGFDVGNDDKDHEGGERDGQLMWSGSVQNYENKSGFGRVTLSATVEASPPTLDGRPQTLAFPAPAGLRVDGRLDEPAWHLNAAATKPTHGATDNRMRFGLLWDASYLYVGVRVEDKRLVNNTTTRNSVWTVTVVDPAGRVLYESEPTPDQRFDVEHLLTNAGSLKGGRILMRPRDRSVERDARRFKLGALALVGLIDVMMVGGLLFVHANVRRQVELARVKSDFVANVSHELKTPLSLIHLFAEMLESGLCPTEEKRLQYYQIINKESQRLTTLIDNMLDLARIEAGRKEYRIGPVALAPVLDEVIKVYRSEIEQQGFVLEAHIDESVPAVMADAAAIWQCIMNLMSNAVKYSRENKYIRIDFRRINGHAHVAIQDHGIGIASSEQDKIFDKFYRAGDSLVHGTKGSGLGLSLVREIMRAHQGRVEVESVPGQGSTFTLVLPLAEGVHESAADHRG
jgi:signal transduction histidine kinase